jgi:hypothetical protein
LADQHDGALVNHGEDEDGELDIGHSGMVTFAGRRGASWWRLLHPQTVAVRSTTPALGGGHGKVCELIVHDCGISWRSWLGLGTRGAPCEGGCSRGEASLEKGDKAARW